MVTYTFTPEEMDLTLEALAHRASRRRSEAQYYPNRRKYFRDCEEKLSVLYQKLVAYRDSK